MYGYVGYHEVLTTVHVRYKSLYVSLPFSAKQQSEMTKFCVFWTTRATTAYILKLWNSEARE